MVPLTSWQLRFPVDEIWQILYRTALEGKKKTHIAFQWKRQLFRKHKDKRTHYPWKSFLNIITVLDQLPSGCIVEDDVCIIGCHHCWPGEVFKALKGCATQSYFLSGRKHPRADPTTATSSTHAENYSSTSVMSSLHCLCRHKHVMSFQNLRFIFDNNEWSQCKEHWCV